MKKILMNIVRFSILNYWILFLFVSYVVATKSIVSKKAMVEPQVEVSSLQTPTSTNRIEKQSIKTNATSKKIDVVPMNTENVTNADVSIPLPTETPTPTPVQDLMSEVSVHNTRSDCWFSYKGHVYNITGYFGQHPGGDQNLANYCGQNVDVAFDTKGKTPSSPHSAQALSIFQQYLVQ